MFTIVKREEMAKGTVVLNEIEAPLIAKKAKHRAVRDFKSHRNR